MGDHPFRDVVTSAAELRAIAGEPSEIAIKKQVATIDVHCREFIARSPFLLLATADAAGRCDVSPKGDAPGFVLVLDDTRLVIPDRPGNRRLDGMRNLVENPHVGLIFLVPGKEETLRVNGRAWIVRDADLLERLTSPTSARTSPSGSRSRSASCTAPRRSSARSCGTPTSGPTPPRWPRPRGCCWITPGPRA